MLRNLIVCGFALAGMLLLCSDASAFGKRRSSCSSSCSTCAPAPAPCYTPPPPPPPPRPCYTCAPAPTCAPAVSHCGSSRGGCRLFGGCGKRGCH